MVTDEGETKNVITIQDTIKKAISLKGVSILQEKSKLCALIEDLSPQLAEERVFLERVYSDAVGRLLFQAALAKESEKRVYLAELDFFLEEQNGYNEKWRRKLLLYFESAVMGNAHVPRNTHVSNSINVSKPIKPGVQNILQGAVFRVMSKDEERREDGFGVGEVIAGNQISKHLSTENLFKILYNSKLNKIGMRNLTDYEWEIVADNYVRTKCTPGQVQVLETGMMIRIKPRVAQLYVTAVRL